MRTCSKCGCYLPDKWDACPACGYSPPTIIANYEVDISYGNGTAAIQKYFETYSEAENYIDYESKYDDKFYVAFLYQLNPRMIKRIIY